jgi:hypothetical protein
VRGFANADHAAILLSLFGFRNKGGGATLRTTA